MRTTVPALRDNQSRLPANQPAPVAPARLRVADLLARKDLELDIPDARVSPDDTLIEGELLHRELRPGLVLHAGSAYEQHAFTLATTQDAGLSCVFFLEGAVTVRYGERTLAFGGGHPRAIDATAVIRTRRETFRRSSLEPQYVRLWTSVRGVRRRPAAEACGASRDDGRSGVTRGRR